MAAAPGLPNPKELGRRVHRRGDAGEAGEVAEGERVRVMILARDQPEGIGLFSPCQGRVHQQGGSVANYESPMA